MSDIKLNIYKRFILPILKPLFDFFSIYGIGPITVVGVPSLIIIILSLRGVKKKSYDYYIRIVGIIIIVITIVVYQVDFNKQ